MIACLARGHTQVDSPQDFSYHHHGFGPTRRLLIARVADGSPSIHIHEHAGIGPGAVDLSGEYRDGFSW